MKKIKRILLVLFGMISPLILSAEGKEETHWKWYTFIEENIHYESDIENNCEYFETVDKNTFIYSNWFYTLEKPEEKEDREIIEVIEELKLSRHINNILKIENFEMDEATIKISEFEILDENNIIVPYKFITPIENINDKDKNTYAEIMRFSRLELKFLEPQDITKLTIKITYIKENNNLYGLEFGSYINDEVFTNLFFSSSTINETECSDNTCEITIKPNTSMMNNEPLIVKTKLYKYREKNYKCFTKNKLYVPGYHKELEGFIKDENDFKIIKISNPEELTIEKNNETIESPKKYINTPEIIEDKKNINDIENKSETTDLEKTEENTIDKIIPNINDTIAMITKEDSKLEEENIYLYTLILIFLLCLTLIVTKNVLKSRTK